MDGAFAEVQLTGDDPVGTAFGNETEDLNLARGKAGRGRSMRPHLAATAGVESRASPGTTDQAFARRARRRVGGMGTVAVDGAALEYDVRGDGPCVVFVHGTGTHRLTFGPVLDAMPTGNTLVTYDRRGFGESRGPLARRMDQHAEDLAGLVQHLGRGAATVVAQSGGAVVALQLAASRPELVTQLILAEPVVHMTRVPSLAALGATGALLRRWALGHKEEAVVGFYRWSSGRGAGTNAWDTVPEEWQDIAVQHADAVVREIRQMIVPRPSSRTIRSVSSPTTLVVGDVGPAVFHRTTRRVARLLPQSTTVNVSDSGHLIAIDQPAAFAAIVADVLTS